MTSGPGYGNGYGYGFGPEMLPGDRWRAAAGQARMRACDADRERTADQLRTAFVEGRLSQDELDERLGRVYAARTYADLAAQTADLPVPRLLPSPAFRPPAVAATTNGLAVASFVCALLQPFFGLTTIPAVILGHSARRQIRRTGQRGDGLAVAGLVLGWLGLVVFTLMLVGFVVAAGSHGAVSHSTVIFHPPPNPPAAP